MNLAQFKALSPLLLATYGLRRPLLRTLTATFLRPLVPNSIGIDKSASKIKIE